MSAATRSSSPGPIVAILALILCGGALWLFLGRSYPLERSAIGFEGLGTWLGRNGVAVTRLPPAFEDPATAAMLRILPVYDNDMSDTLFSPGHNEDMRRRAGSLSPRDMSREAFEQRIAGPATLVVLPKWRGGIVSRGRAHPDLLIPLDDIWFFEVAGVLRRPGGEPLREWTVTDVATGRSPGRVTLYAPQVLGSGWDDYCDPIWQVDGVGTLLSHCEGVTDNGVGFFVLSDPDLLDNHGLSLGRNATMAIEMVRAVAPEAPVYIDPGGEAAPKPFSEDRKDFADPSRFFRYPFSLVWIGVGLMTLLALWRGNVRFGHARVRSPPSRFQSKRDTIRASGRLMRLAGGEGDLIEAYAVARMEALSDRLLGKAARAGSRFDPATAVLRLLDRRAPELGTRLARAYRSLTTDGRDETSGTAALDAFEHVFQEILDEFGRASLPSHGDRA